MLSLSDWITTLSLVFGGCCSNAITLERITSDYPHSGVLVTFFQFLIVTLYGLPSQFTLHGPDKEVQANGSHKHTVARRRCIPRLKKRRVPLLPYFLQVALFFVLSTLNNAAFAYHIPMTVHIVFRSGGMIINMFLGWMFAKKRYTPRQIVSVIVVTVGIVLTTLSASKPKSQASIHITDVSLYTQGILILTLALILSGFLGLIQDWVFTQYIKPSQSQSTSDTFSQSSWQENMFYLHSLALPLFYFSKENITNELARMSTSPHVSTPFRVMLHTPLPGMPSMFMYLLMNTATQLLCVIGVNRLTGRVSSLTVTLILTVRKAVSLLLSVAIYGGQGSAKMWAGASLVFIGTIGYSIGSRREQTEQIKDKTE
ncbi:UAA transporter [Phlebopus sp. FC_14]|nr:UAA transporter [Phlebopus sp. FC_14]